MTKSPMLRSCLLVAQQWTHESPHNANRSGYPIKAKVKFQQNVDRRIPVGGLPFEVDRNVLGGATEGFKEQCPEIQKILSYILHDAKR